MEQFGVPPDEGHRGAGADRRSRPTTCPACRASGVKTAALLINEYGDLDTLLARAVEIKQPKRRESLIDFRRPGAAVADAGDPRHARAGRGAARRDCWCAQPDAETLTGFLRRLEFSTLLRRIADGLGVERPPVPRRRRDAAAQEGRLRPPAGARRAETSSPSGPSRSIRAKERLAVAPRRTSARPKLAALPFDRAQIRDGDPS